MSLTYGFIIFISLGKVSIQLKNKVYNASVISKKKEKNPFKNYHHLYV